MRSERSMSLAIDGQPSPLRVRACAHFLARARGLLWAAADDASCGIRLDPCRAVHTFGMRRAIDVVFVDANGVVRRVFSSLRPWRVAFDLRARVAYEFSAGTASRFDLAPGHRLQLGEPLR